MRRIFRFLKALWRYFLHGHRVEFGVYSRRIQCCSECSRLNKEDWTCGVCGCYLTKKAQMDTEECPEGRWQSI